MKKKGGFVRILSLFLSCILTFCLFSIKSYAYSNLDGFYQIPINQPSTSDTQGYLEVLSFDDDYGDYKVSVFYWNLNPYIDGTLGDPDYSVRNELNIIIDSYNNYIQFTPVFQSATIYMIDSTSNS